MVELDVEGARRRREANEAALERDQRQRAMARKAEIQLVRPALLDLFAAASSAFIGARIRPEVLRPRSGAVRKARGWTIDVFLDTFSFITVDGLPYSEHGPAIDGFLARRIREPGTDGAGLFLLGDELMMAIGDPEDGRVTGVINPAESLAAIVDRRIVRDPLSPHRRRLFGR